MRLNLPMVVSDSKLASQTEDYSGSHKQLNFGLVKRGHELRLKYDLSKYSSDANAYLSTKYRHLWGIVRILSH